MAQLEINYLAIRQIHHSNFIFLFLAIFTKELLVSKIFLLNKRHTHFLVGPLPKNIAQNIA